MLYGRRGGGRGGICPLRRRQTRTGGSRGRRGGRRGGRGTGTARQLVLGDAGCAVLVLEVPGVRVDPAAGRAAAARVPVDGDALRVVDARRQTGVARRDGRVARRERRVDADERTPRHTLARRRHRRR